MSEKNSKKEKLKPIVLVVLDGWGISEGKRGNAISAANLPTMDKVNKNYPCVALQASGISVGLPWGEPGNSEVGHMTMGTGKVIYQSMPRITMAIQSGEFYTNPAFLKAIEHVKKNNSSLHLMGLIGKGAVHSSADHLYALLELAKKQRLLNNVFIHAFSDGRDSSPTSGIESIKELQKRMRDYGVGKIATIGGRYYGMDRNNNWDRIEKAYVSITEGKGEQIENIERYLKKSYAKEVFDEYIVPAIVTEDGKPVATIEKNDAVIFFNYREDRARQITKAFIEKSFKNFERTEIDNLLFVSMVQYEDGLTCDIAFPPIEVTGCLGEILSSAHMKQLRIAETEKFAHVTYFFNGGNEETFPGEDRVIVPSKDVPSFDQAPEMSAKEITDKVMEAIDKDKYDFILINFANADIVGHTGQIKAAITAVETIDWCLDKIITAVLKKEGCLLITADHGNVEEMTNSHTGETDTEHSINPVPCWFISPNNHRATPTPEKQPPVAGLLSDIAPTVLELVDIPKPKDMTGESLLEILK